MEAIFFIIFAFGSLIGGFLLEGGEISGLWGPTALIIVVGGTIGATGVSIRGANLKNVGTLAALAFKGRKSEKQKLYDFFQDIAQRARANGVVSLESDSNNQSIDKFIRTGLMLVVDGTNTEKVKEILEINIEQMTMRHKANIAMFESAGGYAPTMGIIGTVMGLVHVLANLSDADSLGPKIAVAFLATLYGISTANLLYLPIANKLKALHAVEVNEKYMILEGLIAVANGDSPTEVGKRLGAFMETKKGKG